MAHGRRWLIGVASMVALAVALVLIAAGAPASLAADGIFYVDANSEPGGDGESWETAFTDLQDALTADVAPPVEIWVAAGTYRPTSGGDRTISFSMKNGVAIYGGFDQSTGDTTWEDRDWEGNETILSGDIGILGDSADNSYRVFYNTGGLDSTAILDGFTITGGNADGDELLAQDSGGGMYNDASSPTLTNVTFEGNSASGSGGSGGGMYNYQSSPELTDCIFTGNSANGSNDIGGSGGGMYNYQSSPELTNCTFTDNSANGGDGSGASGGGMDNTGESSPALTGCIFSRNAAADEGGGIHNDGSSPTLTGCTFSENTADAGGGIYNGSSSPTLTDVTFADNEANSGGGMHNDDSSPVLVNCTFTGNSAAGNGGGMRNKSDSFPTLTNCTFHGNSAPIGHGGAIQNYLNSPPTLTNCILWGDTIPEIYDKDSTPPIITYSDVEGGYIYPGPGNISANPLFVDAVNANLHLMPGSPCIDAGTDEAIYLPDKDFEGDPRSMDGDRDGTATVDMGVDEALWHPVYLPLVLRGY